MSIASDLKDNPSQEIQDALKELQSASGESESMVQRDFYQEDGSVLSVASFQGGEATLHATDNLGHDSESVAPTVPSPVLPDSPPPQGQGDDGVMRNESGSEMESN